MSDVLPVATAERVSGVVVAQAAVGRYVIVDEILGPSQIYLGGSVSTPDGPELSIDGNIRFTSKVRRATWDPRAETGTKYEMLAAVGVTTRAWYLSAYATTTAAGWYNDAYKPDGTRVPTNANVASGTQLAAALPVDVDVFFGSEFLLNDGTAQFRSRLIRSTDGVTWAPIASTNPRSGPATGALRNPAGDTRIGSTNATDPWPDRIYWAQLDAINRAQLQFPGMVGSWATVPNASVAALPGDVEFVFRASVPDWYDALTAGFVGKFISGARTFLIRKVAATLQIVYVPVGQAVLTSPWTTPAGLAPNQLVWWRFRYDADNGSGSHVMTLDYSAAPDLVEPTTWTSAGAPIPRPGAAALAPTTWDYTIGSDDPTRGALVRIARVIIRDGFGGPAVLDVSENDAGIMATPTTFKASTGQTVTVYDSGALAHLRPSLGSVSTPDTPSDYFNGDVRLRARLYLESPTTTTALIAMQRNSGASNIAWDYYTSATMNGRFRQSADGTSFPHSTTVHPDGYLVPGVGDQYVGWRYERIGTGSVTAGEASLDGGVTWADIVNQSRTSSVDQFDSTTVVSIGAPTSGAQLWPGRFYWVHLEAINRAWLTFPGVAGSFLSTPDDPAFRITGDIEIVARLAIDWQSTLGIANQVVVGRLSNQTADRCYAMRFDLAYPGRVRLIRFGNDGSNMSATATSGVPFTKDQPGWVKITHDSVTGTTKFWTAPDQLSEPTTWTQLGGDRPGYLTPTYPGAAPMTVGNSAYSPSPLAGRVMRAIVRNGIGGPIVFDVRQNDAGGTKVTGDTFVSASGHTMTALNAASAPNLYPSIGVATTPDTPDVTINGPVRITAKLRPDFDVGTVDLTFAAQWSVSPTSDQAWFLASRSTGLMFGRYDAGGTRLDYSTMTLAEMQARLQRGKDAFIGVDVVPRGPAPGVAGITSTDGTTWTRVRLATSPAFTVRDVVAPVTAGSHGGANWQGPLYWAQVEEINRVGFMFPGVVGNYLYVNDAPGLNTTSDLEVVVRLGLASWRPSTNQEVISKYQTSGALRSWRLLINGNGSIVFYKSGDGTGAPSAAGSFIPDPGDGATLWIKVTKVGTACSFFWAPDSPNEPTVWNSSGTQSYTTAEILPTATPVFVGQLNSGTAGPVTGRIRRAIYRTTVGGPAVLDIDEANADTTTTGSTFTATTGQTVNIAQSSGVTILQPVPNRVVWRFDAAEYPGGAAMSFTDPRGRTWTLSAAGAIIPGAAPIVQQQPNTTIWRFDASEYPGTGTTFTDPRGRVWTLSAAGAIQAGNPAKVVQPQPDKTIWRFDVADYPGSGTLYIDPRGRQWTLDAAGAIVPANRSATVTDVELLAGLARA